MPTAKTGTANYAASRRIELAAILQDQLLHEPLPAGARRPCSPSGWR
jgi:hypothetical protein